MAHKITRLKAKLLNTPHLIDEQSFNAILSYINDRNATGILAERDDDDEDKYERSRFLYNDESRTAILNIEGPLTAKSTGMEMLCGGTSYEGLKEDFADAVELGAKTVAWMVDSPGGEAATMLDTDRRAWVIGIAWLQDAGRLGTPDPEEMDAFAQGEDDGAAEDAGPYNCDFDDSIPW